MGYTSDNNSAIFKTVDGGATWNHISSKTAANISVTNDSKAFFVSGREDSIYRTTDGGVTITGYRIPLATLYDIFFSDNNNGLCTSSTGMYNTTNGGNSWNLLTSLPNLTTNDQPSLFMYDNANAWVCYSNKIYHANGNLATWKLDSVPSPVSNIGLIGLYATSSTVVYCSSYTGYLFKSTDGGNHFSFLRKMDAVNNGTSFSDLHFIDANLGYMSVGSRIYKTTDAGNNWTVVVALGTTDISEIHFTDATHGWACCEDGTVLKLN